MYNTRSNTGRGLKGGGTIPRFSRDREQNNLHLLFVFLFLMCANCSGSWGPESQIWAGGFPSITFDPQPCPGQSLTIAVDIDIF